MATLTYDPTEQVEGELSEDEKDSLEVGEKLAEEEGKLLAGKFKNAEDLEQSYIELQKKLGEPKEETAEPEEKPEAKEEEAKEEKEEDIDTAFLDTLWDEAQDKWTDETLDKLGKMSARDIAQMHLQYRADNQPQQSELTEENVKDLKAELQGYIDMVSKDQDIAQDSGDLERWGMSDSSEIVETLSKEIVNIDKYLSDKITWEELSDGQ